MLSNYNHLEIVHFYIIGISLSLPLSLSLSLKLMVVSSLSSDENTTPTSSEASHGMVIQIERAERDYTLIICTPGGVGAIQLHLFSVLLLCTGKAPKPQG
uniref:Uncharacterized protein n=1 Tax=Nelumbo nucifera TaxID=4432 RepID=A0A822XU10_NELNU|nr:TPA_asm: hypothetical protein HUJ06_025333 [Nelumbo nucifera]